MNLIFDLLDITDELYADTSVSELETLVSTEFANQINTNKVNYLTILFREKVTTIVSEAYNKDVTPLIEIDKTVVTVKI